MATLETSGELHALLRKVDPSRFRDDRKTDADARAQLERITTRVRALFEAASNITPANDRPGKTPLRTELAQLLAALDRAQKQATVSTPRAFWTAFVREVHPAYEALASWLRSERLPAKNLRPTNYARNLFHVGSAIVALLVLAFAPSRIWVIAGSSSLCLTAWTLEITRRFSPAWNDTLVAFFGKVAHAHERYRVNSSTWYLTALVLLSCFASTGASAIAVAVLGFGDPVAALVGRRWGKTRLRAGRSLEGSLAFVAVAAVVAFAVTRALMHGSLRSMVVLSLVAAIVGAIVEVFSTKVDDNFTIPLAVGLSATMLASLLAVV